MSSLLKSSVLVSAWTLVSRVLGFLREMITADKLGASAASDAFFVAIMIPNLLRRLFAEGAFNVSFVPLLARAKEQGDKEEAQRFAAVALTWLAIVLAVITVLAEIFMEPVIAHVVAPGLAKEPAVLALTTFLSRLTFPYLMLITFTSLAGGVCNTYGKFAPYAAVPVLLNIVFIAVILGLTPLGIEPATAAAIAMPVGGVLQMAYMWHALKKIGFRLTLTRNPQHKYLKPLLLRLGPAGLALGILQISFLIDMHLASYLGDNAISYLNYANRFYQLPLALIGTALATVLLPHLSTALKRGEQKEANQAFTHSLTYGLVLSTGAAIIMLMLSEPLMKVFFQHGAFTAESAHKSALAMMAFCAGLPAFIVAKVTVTTFYANEDTRTPVKISAICLGINIVLNLLLMQVFAHVGIAAATAIAGWCNAFLQLYFLRKQKFIRLTHKKAFYKAMTKTAILTVITAALLAGFLAIFPAERLMQIIWLGAALSCSGLVYAAGCHFTGLVNVKEVINNLRSRTPAAQGAVQAGGD